jgi:hypothetical protein
MQICINLTSSAGREVFRRASFDELADLLGEHQIIIKYYLIMKQHY